jgi:hypothetical protein
MASGVAVANEADRTARTCSKTETIFEAEADGLAAWVLRAGPEQKVCGLPDPREGGGQYLLVVSGSVVHDGKELPKWSTIFLSREEPPVPLMTGASGLDLLVLQFPQPGSSSRRGKG